MDTALRGGCLRRANSDPGSEPSAPKPRDPGVSTVVPTPQHCEPRSSKEPVLAPAAATAPVVQDKNVPDSVTSNLGYLGAESFVFSTEPPNCPARLLDDEGASGDSAHRIELPRVNRRREAAPEVPVAYLLRATHCHDRGDSSKDHGYDPDEPSHDALKYRRELAQSKATARVTFPNAGTRDTPFLACPVLGGAAYGLIARRCRNSGNRCHRRLCGRVIACSGATGSSRRSISRPDSLIASV